LVVYSDAACSYASKDSCIEDSQCGFCRETGTCLPKGPSGPCFGACNDWQSNGATNEAPHYSEVPSALVDDVQNVYLDDKVFVHYVASLGTYDLYPIVDNHPNQAGKCPSIPSAPLYHGTVQYRNYIASPFRDRSVLFHNPENGDFAIWKCQQFSYERHVGSVAPCSTVAAGRWPFVAGIRDVLTFNDISLIYDDKTGNFGFFNNSIHAIDGSEDRTKTNWFSSAPLSEHHLPELKGHRIIGVGKSYFLEVSPKTGQYGVWLVDKKKCAIIYI
jgi:hypothetical protein